jgi:hypothetical protein
MASLMARCLTILGVEKMEVKAPAKYWLVRRFDVYGAGHIPEMKTSSRDL